MEEELRKLAHQVKLDTIETCARVVERWSLPTIQTTSMWLIDQAGIAADIRALALPSTRCLCPNGLEHGNCLFPDCVSSCPGRLAHSSTDRDAAAEEMADRWPLGCHSPNSCSRNGRCMYVGCKHDGKDIRALATAFTPTPRATPDEPLTENKQ